MNNIFESRHTNQSGKSRIPIWFMRQAGRYHQHYQAIRKNHDFMEMCKNPELACEITLGPIEDFKFDAAILFSDLLFPLEQMNLGLSYHSGPPTLQKHLKTLEDVKAISLIEPASSFYLFQQQALQRLKEKLPSDVTLLGFVGAPFTLYTYAVEGAHKGNLVSSKQGLYDGRFQAFWEILFPNLIENMKIQAQGGTDCICLFDTAAGELSCQDYTQFVAPKIRELTQEFKRSHPEVKITYYSKMTHPHYWEQLLDSKIDTLGIDWRCDLIETLKNFGQDFYIQGNIDPIWLHLPWEDLKTNLQKLIENLDKNNVNFSKWIAGLGHGVTVQTPEQNVKDTVEFFHQIYR